MAIRWSGSALRRARPRLRRPSPASATTMAAPTRQQAYTATVRSIPGRISRATRCPGRTPARSSPTARSAIRCSRSAKLIGAGGVPAELGDRDLVVVRPVEQAVPQRAIGSQRAPSVGSGSSASVAHRRRRSAPTPRRPSRPEARPPSPGARPAGRAGRPPGAAGDADRAGSGSRTPDPAGPRPAAPAGRRARRDRRPRRPGWRGSGGSDSSGMSATKSRTARRRTGSAYGLANASRTAGAGPAGTGRWWRGRTPGVRAQTVSSSGPDRARRDQTGRCGVGGDGHAGVGEHDAGQQLAVPFGPARAAPVHPSRGRRRPPDRSPPAHRSADPGRRSARPACAAGPAAPTSPSRAGRER